MRGKIGVVGAGNLVELEWERVCGKLVEGGGELVDGVIGPGERAVAATIDGGDLEIGVDLLCGFDGGDDGVAVIEFDAAGVRVDDEGRVDQVAMMGDKPVGAVELAAFLICGEGEDKVALRRKVLAMEAQEAGHEDGVGLLHILRAAAVVVAVLLDELEGIGGPVAAQGFNDVEVAEEEDGLFSGRALGADADNEVLLFGVGADQLHIVWRKAGIEKALLHCHGCRSDAALRRVGGVDLDKLLEDCVGFGDVGRRGGRKRALGN